MKITMLVIMFLLIGAFFIISQNNLYMFKQGNLTTFASLYTGWLTNLAENSVKTAGYVVKLEWLPKNSS